MIFETCWQDENRERSVLAMTVGIPAPQILRGYCNLMDYTRPDPGPGVVRISAREASSLRSFRWKMETLIWHATAGSNGQFHYSGLGPLFLCQYGRCMRIRYPNRLEATPYIYRTMPICSFRCPYSSSLSSRQDLQWIANTDIRAVLSRRDSSWPYYVTIPRAAVIRDTSRYKKMTTATCMSFKSPAVFWGIRRI
jgi:hypothetical protein